MDPKFTPYRSKACSFIFPYALCVKYWTLEKSREPLLSDTNLDQTAAGKLRLLKVDIS